MRSPRNLPTLVALLPALAVSAQAIAAADAAYPVFQAGSQYTATLEQTRNQWRFQPANGQDVVIDVGSCATGAMVPIGVWLLVIDAQGRPELLAPSVTRLPAGTPDRIALRACDKAKDHELAVPQTILDLLAANTGAVYVNK